MLRYMLFLEKCVNIHEEYTFSREKTNFLEGSDPSIYNFLRG